MRPAEAEGRSEKEALMTANSFSSRVVEGKQGRKVAAMVVGEV